MELPIHGTHQSTRNSGVLHTGLYYRPGSAKAILAVRGIRLMVSFARQHAVPYEQCGKVVVVADRRGAMEVLRLRALFERGKANGVRGLEWLSADALRAREPEVRGKAGVLVPEEGIIDYAAVVAALRAEIVAAKGTILTGAPVTGAQRQGAMWRLSAGTTTVTTDFVVNCAGLQSDRVARLFGERPATRIVPFRGDYFTLARPGLVRHLIYPVPDPNFPFLGVHFTRMIAGGVECGPSAVLSLDREGYRRNAIRLRDMADTLTFSSLWRFVARHPGPTFRELARAQSKWLFLAALRRLVPALELLDLRPGLVGVRAQAMKPDGSLADDFDFLSGAGALHVLNAPSPSATASLAIGEEIARRVARESPHSLLADTLDLV
jgi:L-2-hydroxyglutarate oxidase